MSPGARRAVGNRPAASPRGAPLPAAASLPPPVQWRHRARRAEGAVMTTDAATTKSVRSFRIDVPDAVLEDLRERLRRTRFPGEVANSGWTYGTNLAYMRELVAYWLENYD